MAFKEQLFDGHVHTCEGSFDGGASYVDILEIAKIRGLDFVAITDHNSLKGAALAKDLRPEGVIPGVEISVRRLRPSSVTMPHLLIYFPDSVFDRMSKDWRRLPVFRELDYVIEWAEYHEATIVVPHAKRNGALFSLPFDDVIKYLPDIHGVEIINGKEEMNYVEERLSLRRAINNKVSFLANSDAHRAEDVGKCANRLFVECRSTDEVLEAIRNRQVEMISVINQFERKVVRPLRYAV
jgi:predicted metal-dependent phosphoesterase TrpH